MTTGNRQWHSKTLETVEETTRVLAELQGLRWLSRGEPECYTSLVPSLDRQPYAGLDRVKKLAIERQSIDWFRSLARDITSEGERASLSDDFIALMVLQQNKLPTRLLDWSFSPYVALHFAVCKSPNDDGVLWAFDEPAFQCGPGPMQWERWPETTSDGSGNRHEFDAKLTAFQLENLPDWFTFGYYPKGFPRQNAQQGAYSLTARFGIDHAVAFAGLFEKDSGSHVRRYVIPASLKPELADFVREQHGIWRGSLFPDSAGAAESVRIILDLGQAADKPCNNTR